MKLQYIVWEDHCSYSERWRERSEVDNKPVIIASVGWVLQEDDKCVTLTACQDTGDGPIKHVSTVLKSCIIRRKNLKV